MTPLSGSSMGMDDSHQGEEEDGSMYRSLKGRQRKPSQKILLASTEPAGVALPRAAAASTAVSSSHKSVAVTTPRAVLSLQSAVGEVMLHDVGESNSPRARTQAITLEWLSAAEWRMHGFQAASKHRRVVKRTLTPKGVKVEKVLLAAEPEADRDESVKKESTGSLSLEVPVENTVGAGMVDESAGGVGDIDGMSDGGSSSVGSKKDVSSVVSPSGAGEGTKRKRGRPFKGQEKPIEERLMVETCKIRRLIDDILRKGQLADSNDLCLRLKGIAADLDDALHQAASAGIVIRSPPTGPVQTTTATHEEMAQLGEEEVQENTDISNNKSADEPPLPSHQVL